MKVLDYTNQIMLGLDFKEIERREDGIMWVHKRTNLSAISSIVTKEGKDWLHVSFAHKKRMPTYEEITSIKSIFIGDDNYAFMIFPPKENHVNIHNFCLHLWHCIDGHPFPEFSGFLVNGVRSI